MKLVVAVLVVASALAGSAAPARAQEQAPVPVSSVEQRSEELSTWLKEYRAWEKWYELWGNRVARNGSGFENLGTQAASGTACMARRGLPRCGHGR